MQQHIDEKFINFASRCRKTYENRLGHTLDTKSRKRENVEERVALVAAMRPYCTVMTIAKTINKDHSSMVHNLKSHDVHMRYSPRYAVCFDLATESVYRESVKADMIPREVPNHVREMIREVESLSKAVEQSKKRLNKFLEMQSEKKWILSNYDEKTILSLKSETF